MNKKLLGEAKLEMLIARAVQWWRGKRPCGWTLKQHLENPGINCCSTETEAKLGIAVGNYLTRPSRGKRKK